MPYRGKNMRKNVEKFIENRRNVAIFLFLVVVLTKLPVATLDYHWDSVVVASQAKYYTGNSLLSVPPGIILHTPLLPWTVAGLYTVFGEVSIAPNLLIMMFSFIGVYFLFLFGKEVYNCKVGFIAALLLFFSSMYFSLSGQLLYDVPLTAMTILTLYFYTKQNTKLYLVSASLLVLTKESGLLAVAAILIYSLKKREGLKKFVVLGLPLVFIVLWGIFVLANIDKVGAGGYFSETSQGQLIIIQKAATIIYQVGIWNYNWLLLISILYMFLRYKPKIDNRLKPLLLTAVLYFIFFSVSPTFLLPKYILPIYPAFILLGAVSIIKITKSKGVLITVIILLLFASTYSFNIGLKSDIQDPVFHLFLKDKPISSMRSGELSLDYTDILNVQGQVLNYLFENHKGSIIVSTYPLAEDSSVYTNVGRRQWKANSITVFTLPTVENINKSDLIIVESYGNFNNDILERIKNRPVIKSFEINGKKTDIYGKG